MPKEADAMHVEITQHELAVLEEVLDHTLDELEAKLYTTTPTDAPALQQRVQDIRAVLSHVEAQQPMSSAERASLDGLVGTYR